MATTDAGIETLPELSGDPWEWPDLTGSQLRSLAKGSAALGPEAPIFQYDAVRRCNVLRIEIERTGSGFAVLAAVRICGTHGLRLPIWLVYAFNRRYDAVLQVRTLSWDDPLSFGRPYPKGTNRAALWKKRNYQVAVLVAVQYALECNPRPPIDKALFERIGSQFGLGATLTEEYYYEAVNRGEMKAKPKRRSLRKPEPPNPAKMQKNAGIKNRTQKM